jgi:hypothetical protein
LSPNQLVDLGRNDEIIIAQATDRMRRQFDTQDAITRNMQVRMVPLGFGQVRDPIEALNRFHEILEPNLPSNPTPVVAQCPQRYRRQLGSRMIERAWFHSPFAGQTFGFR